MFFYNYFKEITGFNMTIINTCFCQNKRKSSEVNIKCFLKKET